MSEAQTADPIPEAPADEEVEVDDDGSYNDGYVEGVSEGKMEAKGAAVELWTMVQGWAERNRFIEPAGSDGHTAQDLMDAVLVAFGERKPSAALRRSTESDKPGRREAVLETVRAHKHTCANVQPGSTHADKCDCGALDTAGQVIPRSTTGGAK